MIGPYYFVDETAAAVRWLAGAGIAHEQLHKQTVVTGNATHHQSVTVVRFRAARSASCARRASVRKSSPAP
jgi:hypothetical protein